MFIKRALSKVVRDYTLFIVTKEWLLIIESRAWRMYEMLNLYQML